MNEEMVTLAAITENNIEKCGPTGETFTYVDISSIDREKKVISEPKVLASADAPSRARQVLCNGDVLVSMTRPNLNAVAMVTPEFNGSIGSTGFHVLRSQKALPKFLFYVVQSNSFIDEMCNCVQGALYPAVRPKDISSFEFFLPSSFEEQQSIVAAIDTQFSRLDEAVASLKRIQANLKRYKAAVLKAAVEGKLTEQWRNEHPAVEPADQLLKRILAERRARWEAEELAKMKAKGIKPKDDSWKKKYKEPAGPDTINLPELPEGWVWATIEQVTECLDSKRIPINKKERANRQGNIPYYGANGQVGWIDEYLFDEPLVLVVEDETFTGREIPFSYKITGKSWVNNHAHVLRNTGAVTIDYLNNVLSYYPFIPLTTGTTGRKKLTQAALISAPLKLPPTSEQVEIVAEIDHRLSVTEELETTIGTNLKRAERLRQTILQRAFSGGLG